MKECTKCLTKQELDNFPLRKDGTHTRRAICKTCVNKYMKQYRSGYTIASNPVDTRPVDKTNVAQPNRINIWNLPVYVQPKWGR